jgi:hypothetical protein
MRKAIFSSVILFATTSAAFATNWVRESSDSWMWVDVDSIHPSGGNLTYYTHAIGCNGQGGMPERGADGFVSPAQCMFGTPTTDAFNCTTGEVYDHDIANGALVLEKFNPGAFNTIFRMVCGHDMPPTPGPATPPPPSRAAVESEAERDWSALGTAVWARDVKKVRALLARGVNPDTPHPDHEDELSPLDNAACQGTEAMATLLLKHGAGIESRENVGSFTPLMFAANCGNATMEAYLLRHGASVNTKDNKGWTPLDFALSKKDAKHRRAAQLLLAHGAVSGKVP